MKQSQMYDSVQGIYRSFFSKKIFKELKVIDINEGILRGSYIIYEIWFKDIYTSTNKPCEYSHNIVVLK